MTNEILLAGFGGQGILFMGKMLAYFGLYENKEVSWLPSYGPEMRGGTCNCSVCVSDDPIGSPLVDTPNTLIVMNTPSSQHRQPQRHGVASGGTPCCGNRELSRPMYLECRQA